MKKILVIENSVDITGAFNAVLRSSIGLRNEFKFIFVIPKGSNVGKVIQENGFTMYEVPMLEISKRWRSILLYIPLLFVSAFRLQRVLKKERIGLVHVNDFYNMNMPLLRLLGGGVKYIACVNFVPDRFPAVLRKIWIQSHVVFASKLVGVSRYVIKQLPQNANVALVPDCLPLPVNVTFPETRRQILLCVGNFIQGKGQEDAIQAFAEIAGDFPEWKMRFVGGDMGLRKNQNFLTSLKKMALELALGDRIEWVGFSESTANEYANAAIALNFSVSESFSLTVQEGMFYGCAVIATNSGGPAEIIDSNENGILVEVKNIHEMAAAMKFLISDPDALAAMGKRAYQTVREKFAPENTVEKLKEIYRKVLAA